MGSSKVILGASPAAQMVKNMPAMQENPGLIPGSRRSPGEANSYPTPVFLPGESMDGGAWWAPVHGAAKRKTWLSN